MCPLIIQGVNSIYQDAIKVSEGKKIIWTFQQFLKDVITWYYKDESVEYRCRN
jgi:hypothetical protein